MEDSLPRWLMCLVPIFIPETHNQMNNECFPKFVQTDNASSSIKTAIITFTFLSDMKRRIFSKMADVEMSVFVLFNFCLS